LFGSESSGASEGGIPPSIEGDRAGDGFTAAEAGIEDEGEVREPQRAASPFVLSRC